MNPVEIFVFIGGRGMGVPEFEPAVMKEYKRPFSIDIDSLVEITSKLLNLTSKLSASKD